MKSVVKKIAKYIFKPHILAAIICKKIIYYIRYLTVLYASETREIRLGKRVSFLQKMIISGSGSLKIGEDCFFGYKKGGYFYKGACELQPRYKNSKIIIGKNVRTNNNLFICCADEVSIGDDTLIGEGVMIIDHDAHGIKPSERRNNIGKISSVILGKNVWIGSRVTILRGTKIGDNSVIGAGSIVKGEFPDNAIIAGSPAKVIKKIEG
jgi:acetyltransferase-like isoleucine patch superfamily enzyme